MILLGILIANDRAGQFEMEFKMIGKSLLSQTPFDVVSKSLDANMLRSRVIANNIANVNTPGYKRTDVNFEGQLRDAIDRSTLRGTVTNERHVELGRPRVTDVEADAYHPIDGTLPSGVNNVDIDHEMANLAETQLA